MTFFWSKVCGPLGKTPYIYPRYQVWGVTDLGFDFWRSPLDYHPPEVQAIMAAPPAREEAAGAIGLLTG